MKNKSLILFFLTFSLNLILFAQSGFEKLYAPYANKTHAGYSIVQSFNSGYIITGNVYSTSSYSNVLLMKINNSGDITWVKNFSIYQNAIGKCIRRTTDSCYIICGRTGNIFQGFLMKINDNGDTLWTRRYIFSGYTSMESVNLTKDGGFILSGYVSNPNGTSMLIMKVNQAGQEIWHKLYGNPNHENCGNSVQETSDNGFIIAGSVEWYMADSTLAFLTKTDAQGNLSWMRYFGNNISSGAYSVVQSPDRGFLWAGRYHGNAFIIKCSNTGDSLWARQMALNSVQANSIISTPDSGFACCGTSYNTTTCGVFLSKLDQAGNIQWSHNYNQTGSRYGYQVNQSQDNGYIIVGIKETYASSMDSIYIIKSDTNGIITGDSYKNPIYENKMIVFPNPVCDKITLELLDFDGSGTVTVLTSSGTEISNQTISDKKIAIDLSRLQNGVYFIKVRTKGLVGVEKVIKI